MEPSSGNSRELWRRFEETTENSSQESEDNGDELLRDAVGNTILSGIRNSNSFGFRERLFKHMLLRESMCAKRLRRDAVSSSNSSSSSAGERSEWGDFVSATAFCNSSAQYKIRLRTDGCHLNLEMHAVAGSHAREHSVNEV